MNNKIKNIKIIDSFAENLNDHDFFSVSSYSGMSVAEMEVMRRIGKKLDIKIFVVKNSFLKIAAEKSDYNFELSDFSGQHFFVFSNDVLVAAQFVLFFSKEYENCSLKSAFLKGDNISLSKLSDIAKIESKELLIFQILSLLLGGYRAVYMNYIFRPLLSLSRVFKLDEYSSENKET